MSTFKVIECITRIISDTNLRASIENRDKHKDYTLESIHSKIVKKDVNANHFRMIVRIGLDYLQRVPDGNIQEDILVDVLYVYNRQSGSETYDILNVTFVPELPNP